RRRRSRSRRRRWTSLRRLRGLLAALIGPLVNHALAVMVIHVKRAWLFNQSLVRAVAERKVLAQAAQANGDGFFLGKILRRNLERAGGGVADEAGHGKT